MHPKVNDSRGRQLLKKLLDGTTQVALADKLAIKQATISQLLRLQMLPSRNVAVKLAQEGIPVESWDQGPAAEEEQATPAA